MALFFVLVPLLLSIAFGARLQTVPKSETIGAIICQSFDLAPRCNCQLYNTSKNIAFSGNGYARPAVAKDLARGYEFLHGAANANDGKYGNGASWIGNSRNSWLKIDLGCVTEIRRVRFGRDRTGGYGSLNNPGQVSVFVATNDVYAAGNSDNDEVEYTKVFSSTGFSGDLAQGETVEAQFPPVMGRYVKLQFELYGAVIDEIEVFGSQCLPGKLIFTPATVTTGSVTCQNFAAAPQCNAKLYNTSANIAFSGNGYAKPAVSKDVQFGYSETHVAANANDGKYGNGASWIGGSANSWVKIDLGCVTEINSVQFGRDRTGGYDWTNLNPGQVGVFVAKEDVYAAGDSDNDEVEYTKVFASLHFSGFFDRGDTAMARFPAVMGRYVKLQVQNKYAAIDEIEVGGKQCLPGKLQVAPVTTTKGAITCQHFAAAPQCNAQLYNTSANIAFSGNGFAKPAVSKDVLLGYSMTHGAANANDGKYGNGATWIGNSTNSWLKIDLGCVTEIRGVRFGRDRTGGYNDRNPGQVSVLVATTDVYAAGNSDDDEVEYRKVFASAGFSGKLGRNETLQADFPTVMGRYVKLETENKGAAVDEIEVAGKACV